MSEAELHDQFAALPARVKVSLFRVLDVLAAQGAGDWRASRETLSRMQLLDEAVMPQPAKEVLLATLGVVTALSLEFHERRVEWARAEGFTEGIELLLAAMRGGPYDAQRVEHHE